MSGDVVQLLENAKAPLDRIMRRSEVLAVTGLSVATLWLEVQKGAFPAPVQISAGRSGYRESEVRAWLAERPRVALRDETREPSSAA
jgi:prophage regulatory protein